MYFHIMSDILIRSIVISFLVICFCAPPKQAQVGSSQLANISLQGGIADSLLLPSCSGTGQLIKHAGYWLCYAEPYEQASWVFYHLSKVHLENPAAERTNDFREDPEVKTGSASPEDYLSSHFDKGHLFCAENASFSSASEHDCFYMSNMSPMAASFNRGIWKKLENRERKWAEHEGDLYVATGGVLHNGLKTIGANSVAVPEAFYKIIVSINNSRCKGIAFLIPNKQCKDSLYNYVFPIDSIEMLTNIDFFSALPDSIESAIEYKSDYLEWY